MKRNTIKRVLAEVLSVTAFMQALPAFSAHPAQQPAGSTVSAANIQSIQTRVYAYDFGNCKALYDTHTEKWFSQDGKPIESQTEDVQRIENPGFGSETNSTKNCKAVVADWQKRSFSAELENGDTRDFCETADFLMQDSCYERASQTVRLQTSCEMVEQAQFYVSDETVPDEIRRKIPDDGGICVVRGADDENGNADLQIYINRGTPKIDMPAGVEGYGCYWYNVESIRVQNGYMIIDLIEYVGETPKPADGFYSLHLSMPADKLPAALKYHVCVTDYHYTNDESIPSQPLALPQNCDVSISSFAEYPVESHTCPAIPVTNDDLALDQPFAIPQDVAAELSGKRKKCARIYHEPEDTDNPAMKEILAQGKDIVGAYTTAQAADASIVAAALDFNYDQLVLMLGYQEPAEEMPMNYIGGMIVVDDGILPDDPDMNLELKKFEAEDTSQSGMQAKIRTMFEQILAVEPEYAPYYYDKAQQKEVAVPKPASFPLTYKFRLTENEDKTNTDVFCDIFFGETLYGTCWLYGREVGFVEFIMADDSDTANTNPYTDAGDATIDGVQDVADAVLTCRVAAEDEDAPVTDLGMELADKNEDGVINVSDVTEILSDIAQTSAELRTDDHPEESIPLISFRVMNDSFEDMAMKLGYESYLDFCQKEIYEKNSNTGSWCKCTEGAETDTWYFVGEMQYPFSRTEITGLSLGADACLNIEGVYFADVNSSIAETFAMAEVVVLHGALPKETFGLWHLEQANALGTFNFPTEITKEQLPENAIRLLTMYTRGMFNAYGTSELQRVFNYDTFDDFYAANRVGDTDYAAAFAASDGGRGQAYDLVWYQPEGEGYHEVCIPKLELDSAGTLTVHADCRFADEASHDPRHFLWVRIEVPADAPAVRNVSFDVKVTHEFLLDEAEARYIDYTPQSAGRSSEQNLISADVETFSQIGLSADPARELVTQEIADAIGDDYNNYLVRQYRDAEDTENEYIQSLLAQGKDVTAIFCERGGTASHFGVSNAEVHADGRLSVNALECQDEVQGCAITYYVILLITDDGEMPAFDTAEVHFTDFECDREGFDAEIQNPLYIARIA